jgi:hypothetical protein
MNINPEIFQYEIFRDLLYIILAFAAVIIGAISFFAYKLIEKRIANQIKILVNETYLKTIAATLTHVGLMCWRNYKVEHIDEIKKRHLEHSLEFTNYAYQKYAINLKENKKENAELICVIKNNLAFYLTEGCRLGLYDREERELNCKLAIDYAEYVYKRKSKFPERAKRWIHTYNFVLFHCKDCIGLKKIGKLEE